MMLQWSPSFALIDAYLKLKNVWMVGQALLEFVLFFHQFPCMRAGSRTSVKARLFEGRSQ
ncbi:hypothetical protein AXF42_Ash002918 [Apostasia shenzhenica]|uniref:Uncharacterized protein n=1 Tax=Apostasia shenzhenica TaxID=1088818 RepID=A0A2I0A7M7_9ASPA|nr:hypothetical protein AXF42_Ash002918 [Apostasia shenzhenica]